MYNHKPVDHVLELDSCLKGLGGHWKNYVYHFPLAENCNNLGIVQLEMVNILLAIKILAKCDNDAVVKVLTLGRAQDPYLSVCARNIWYAAALYDLDISYVHVMGKINVVADLLSIIIIIM